MKFENQTFAQQQVVLDFNEFYGCTFVECNLVLLGYGLTSLVSCTFVSCNFPLEGPAANYALFLRGFYQSKGDGRHLVEEVFRIIRGEVDPFPQSQQEEGNDPPFLTPNSAIQKSRSIALDKKFSMQVDRFEGKLSKTIGIAVGRTTPPSNGWDAMAALIGTVDAPADWAVEHDHYLYGTPKRGEPLP